MDRVSSVESFFHPTSIAVVGVTGTADRVTRRDTGSWVVSSSMSTKVRIYTHPP